MVGEGDKDSKVLVETVDKDDKDDNDTGEKVEVESVNEADEDDAEFYNLIARLYAAPGKTMPNNLRSAFERHRKNATEVTGKKKRSSIRFPIRRGNTTSKTNGMAFQADTSCATTELEWHVAKAPEENFLFVKQGSRSHPFKVKDVNETFRSFEQRVATKLLLEHGSFHLMSGTKLFTGVGSLSLCDVGIEKLSTLFLSC